MRVAGRKFGPGVTDANDRTAIKHVAWRPLITQPTPRKETFFIAPGKPSSAAPIVFFLRHNSLFLPSFLRVSDALFQLAPSEGVCIIYHTYQVFLPESQVRNFSNWIDGVADVGSSFVNNINPSDTSDVVGRFEQSEAGAAEQAVDAAKSAFRSWSRSTPQQRFDVLDGAANEIFARKAELGELLSREEGKTLAEGMGEVARAGQVFKFFAGETLRLAGEVLPSVRPGIDVEVTREPLGVVGLITPWNFPIAIPAWKIAPAIAHGNTVVLKPAEATPASAWRLVDILHKAGLPNGVVNLVLGEGATVGSAIVGHKDVQAVSFTGSVHTGAMIAAQCVKQMKKVQLEMGGKNPLVVMDDADLETAVATAINGAFFSTGQRCTASSRLIVTSGIHDAFVSALRKGIDELRVGHALDAQTQIGPVIDQAQLNKNQSYLDVAAEEGGEVVGGQTVERETDGYFMNPALILGTSNTMRINREEVFGPVASVIKVSDYDEAIAVANDTEFGLSAGICTTSLAHARAFKRDSEAGMVMVNLPTAGVDYHVPFGGRKHSSYGPREQGHYAKEFYTTVKTAYTG